MVLREITPTHELQKDRRRRMPILVSRRGHLKVLFMGSTVLAFAGERSMPTTWQVG